MAARSSTCPDCATPTPVTTASTLSVLDGELPVRQLKFEPGALVVFRGRDALHRVTPTEGDTTRILVVFAFNEQPGIRLSDSALETFYGRLG